VLTSGVAVKSIVPYTVRYPIGKFSFPQTTTADQRQQWITEVAETPAKIRAAVAGLDAKQLNTPYREGGWTVRQVVHHVPESHMNAYIRFKLALTEDDPVIKPYNEAEWAKLPDVADTPIEVSLTLLDVLHDRLVRTLRGMDEAQWKRTFRHPELGPVKLEGNLALYAWHGKHHTAHITKLRERNHW
jgi:DinB family protein